MKLRLSLLLAACIPAVALNATAQTPDQTRDQAQARQQQQIQDKEIYGWQMMSSAERDEFRAKMRAAQTAEERERIRTEHHALMQKRATERGVTLPDEPSGVGPGRGMGPGGGMGPGPGGGMGPGPGGGAGPAR